jgi:hypothetical protein
VFFLRLKVEGLLVVVVLCVVFLGGVMWVVLWDVF